MHICGRKHIAYMWQYRKKNTVLEAAGESCIEGTVENTRETMVTGFHFGVLTQELRTVMMSFTGKQWDVKFRNV